MADENILAFFRAMKIKFFSQFAVLAAVWVVPSIIAFTQKDADSFQRLGSLGVAFLLLLFVFLTISFAAFGKSYPEFKEQTDSYEIRSRSSEVILAAIATLQWGYGDLVVCWFHTLECNCFTHWSAINEF